MKNKLETEDMKDYTMENGVLFKKNKDTLQLYVLKELEREVIRTIHEQLGHQATEKCYQKIKENYWFPDMKNKINNFRQKCIKCIKYSAPNRPGASQLHNIPKHPRPFHTIHLDHLGPLPSLQSKRKHILFIIDAFTKYVKLYPVLITSTKEVTSALKKYFEYYSRPQRCITDRGSCFTSKEFEEFIANENITHVKVAVHSPKQMGKSKGQSKFSWYACKIK